MSVQKGNKKKEIKTDPASFEGKGLFFTAKFIGVSDVADFRGNAMCQETMQKLKAAVKSSGKHKLKILVNISLEGIKLIEEKTMAVNYEHIVSRISFISIDTTDSRAFGYVFEPGDGTHKFFAIKTEKSAGHVIIAIRDLFETVFEMKKKERDEAAQKEADDKDKSAVCGVIDESDAPVTVASNKAKTNETDYGYSVPSNNKPVPQVAAPNIIDLDTDLEYIQQGMDSMGTVLESFDDFPFGQVTTGGTIDPWNVNNSKQYTGTAPAAVVLLPPPPASPRVPIGTLTQASTALAPGQCSLSANLFPMSSAFPSAVSSNVSAQPFSVSLPLTANLAVPKPTDPVAIPPEMAANLSCSLPIVTDPFEDKLFVSAVPAQLSSQAPFTAAATSAAPPTADNTVPFAAFPMMKPPCGGTFPVVAQIVAPNFAPQQSFATFPPPEPVHPVENAFSAAPQPAFSAFPVKPQTPVAGFSVVQQPSFAAFPEVPQPTLLPLSSPDSSQRSTPSKFDAISLDSSFTSVFSQQSNDKLESGSTFANGKLAETGTNPVPQTVKLFQDLCSFGSNQHHKKPAELFPKLEPPPGKKLNELLEESIKCKDQNFQSSFKDENPDSAQQSDQENDFSNRDQASESSITSALPAENSLTDPICFPEPTKFNQPSISAASFSGSDSQSSSVSNDQPYSDSPSIFSFSGNNPTEVTYAMTKLELSDVEFNHPAPSHPPPQLPSHLIASGLNSGSESVCSISPFPDDHWTISDEEFSLPSPTVPPPPLPTGASLNFEPDQAPAPPPRPRTSDITRVAKPPPLPVRPKRTLSSSSSLQSMGKSSSPVSSIVSLEGTVLAHGATSDCSFTSLHDSDVSTNSLPMTKFAGTKLHMTKFADRGSSASSPRSVATGNSNPSPPHWSAFTENDNSSSPFSNQSFSSGRDVSASSSSQMCIGVAGSHDSDWPNNNPFMSKINASPTVRNSSSPDPFSGPYTKIVDKRSKQTPQTAQCVESVCSSTSAQIHDKPSQPVFDSVDPFRVRHCTKPQSNHNQTNTDISGSFCSSDPNADLSDPFVVPLHLKLQTDKSAVDPFVIQTNVNLTQNNTQMTPFFSSTKNTERSNTRTDPFTCNSQTNIQTDPFTSLSQNTVQSGNTPSDPFFSPSHNPAEYTHAQADPFDAFNQWPVSSKFGMDTDKTNGH